jgi:hypothetical protein
MKRGITIALQAAGMLWACLATSLNRPVNVLCKVYYFNEEGEEIFCDTKATSPGNYVIRTCKTPREMFPEWYGRDITKSSGNYQPAQVNAISVSEATEVARLIRNGKINDPLVRKNIIPILDKKSIAKMLSTIKDSCARTMTKRDFREYGGMINKDTTFTFLRGEPTDPRDADNKGLLVGVGRRGNFHSHPGGEINEPINGNQTKVSSFVQGPSYIDQRLIEDKTGYVFGMHEQSQLIYIYDRRGVQATLPFTYLLSK